MQQSEGLRNLMYRIQIMLCGRVSVVSIDRVTSWSKKKKLKIKPFISSRNLQALIKSQQVGNLPAAVAVLLISSISKIALVRGTKFKNCMSNSNDISGCKTGTVVCHGSISKYKGFGAQPWDIINRPSTYGSNSRMKSSVPGTIIY